MLSPLSSELQEYLQIPNLKSTDLFTKLYVEAALYIIQIN